MVAAVLLISTFAAARTCRLHVQGGCCRTLAGRLARFVGFPARVRAIAMEQHPGMGKAAFVAGIFGQLVVTVVGGLILAGLTAGAAALLKDIGRDAPAPGSSPTVTPSTIAPSSPTATPTAVQT